MIKKRYELSIAIPCYNEVESLPLLLEAYRNAKKDLKFQLVIVDNGSNDGTWQYLNKEIKKPEKNFIKIIQINKNIGYGYGIQKGLENCDAEIIGWSHGDLQCSPEDVFKAYKIYQQYNNPKILIKGRRIGRDWKSVFRAYWLEIYATLVLWRIYDDINGQPKLFHHNLFLSFKNPPKESSYDLYVQNKALRLGYKVKSFEVLFPDREFGFSKWTYSTLAKISTIKGFFRDIIKIRVGKIK